MNKTSDKQIIANQNNGMSGGVKTDEGRAISSRNAITHGILSQTVSDHESVLYEPIFSELERDFHYRIYWNVCYSAE